MSPPICLVHMGDSITFGQYVDPSARWTTLVARRLAEAFGEEAFASHNRGVSGETTRMALERFPADLQQLRPQIVTIQFGLNDCNCWESDGGLPRVSEDAFAANLAEMVRRARHFGALEIVLATNHRTLRRGRLDSGERFEDASARYSEIVRRIAREHHVALCDVRTAFERFDDEQLAELVLPAPDLLHLSEEGNRVYAEIIAPSLHESMGRLLAEHSAVGA